MEGRENAGLSSRAANKEDSEVANKRKIAPSYYSEKRIKMKNGRNADKDITLRFHAKKQTKTKIAPNYHSEKRTKKKAYSELSLGEANKERGKENELADDSG